MKVILAATAALGVLAISAPAMAETSVSIGYSMIKADPVDLGAVTARVSWYSSSWFGLEGEAGFGAKDDTVNGPPPVKIKLDSIIGAYATAKADLNPNFRIFARAGVDNASLSGKAGGVKVSADGTNFSYGAGAQLNFGNNGVRFDYTRLDTDNGDAWTISGVHRF